MWSLARYGGCDGSWNHDTPNPGGKSRWSLQWQEDWWVLSFLKIWWKVFDLFSRKNRHGHEILCRYGDHGPSGGLRASESGWRQAWICSACHPRSPTSGLWICIYLPSSPSSLLIRFMPLLMFSWFNSHISPNRPPCLCLPRQGDPSIHLCVPNIAHPLNLSFLANSSLSIFFF